MDIEEFLNSADSNTVEVGTEIVKFSLNFKFVFLGRLHRLWR